MDESEKLLVALASILVLGVLTHWCAWWARIPAILLLLAVGTIAGPVTGFLKPEEVFGDLLQPFVSLSVGLILFEGGLNLRLRELKGTWRSLLGLLTIGVAVTWAGATIAAMTLLELPFSTSLLLGSVLVVTGPTVVGPLLREIRPSRRVSAVAKWEGIAIDPIGATLALLVFEAVEAIHATEYQSAAANAMAGLAMTGLIGTALGLAAAWLFVWMLRHFWIPDYLRNPMALVFVVATFVASNLLHEEAGLLAVTIMGIALSNQRQVDVRHIIEFKEGLTVLLIASLFILISAKVPPGSLAALGWQGPLFAAVLIVIVRPLAVWLATMGSNLTAAERCFLAWLAPRGIVAAAVSSVFAARLGAAGDAIVPAVLVVIFLTVATYGLTANALARRLGLSVQNPQGLLVAGANRVARSIASVLKDNGFKVVLVDTGYEQIQQARDMGLSTCYANVLSEHVLDDADLGGLGRFLAMTPNNEVNTIAAARFRELFGRAKVFQLSADEPGHSRWESEWQQHLSGQRLFHPELTFERFDSELAAGATVKVTRLSDTFGFEAYRAHYNNRAWPLFFIDGNRLNIVSAGSKPDPGRGQIVVSLIMADAPEPGETMKSLAKASESREAPGKEAETDPVNG